MNNNIYLHMSKGLIALCSLSVMSGTAFAAGASKTLKITVNETLLQGYTATPPAGWQQVIQYITASAATDTAQQVAAIVSETRTPTVNSILPKPAAITTISVATGATVKKLNLPAGAQVVRADCTFPVGTAFTGCADASYTAAADQALPGRLIVTAVKRTFDSVTSAVRLNSLTYALDHAAPLADQWTLIAQSSQLVVPGLPLSFDVAPSTRKPDQKLYRFERTSATTTNVFEIANK